MGAREVLTLQFGHYANFVGTHWWNIQESNFDYKSVEPNSLEINHDVLFREGLTAKGETTYTPRLILVDLKGSLKTLPKYGDIYDPQIEINLTNPNLEWDPDKVEVQQEHKKCKNQFQMDLEKPETSQQVFHKNYELEKNVSVWSDFLYTRFHPRTVNIVNEYKHCDTNTSFDFFNLGTELWTSEWIKNEFADKIRSYVEECDYFQGFHMLTDCTNAFSGLSSSCLEYLQDEYDRKSVLVFPVIPSHFSDNGADSDETRLQSILNDSTRVLNLTLAFNKYKEHASMFVPLCTGKDGWRQPGSPRAFYHTEYDHKLPYHSSAILASLLDTVTLKHRLKSTNFSLMDLCTDLTGNGRKMAAASVCFPFCLNLDADLIKCLDNWEGPLSQSLSPRCEIGTDKLMQHVTLRGVPENRLKEVSSEANEQKDFPAYKCNTVKEMLEFYLSCKTYATASNVTTVQKALPVKTPFPQIFDEFVGYNGNIIGKARPKSIRVDSIPILAGLHCGSAIGNSIESLHTEARRIKIGKFHQFNIERDEFEECLDSLFQLRENYEDNYVL